MNRLTVFIAKIQRLPPGQVLPQLVIVLKKKVKNVFFKSKGILRGTHIKTFPHLYLHTYFPPLTDKLEKISAEDINLILSLSNLYLHHYFDLLGSGWVQVRYGMKCRGVEGYTYDMSRAVNVDSEGKWLKGRINRSNLYESQRIWRLIDNKNYNPIDWQMDFKSGYRWSEKTWYKDIRYGHKRGVDIKVPWELARMQHLPMLAWAYGMAKRNLPGCAPPETYLNEFRNQVLDFISTNPPKFGVNWFCTMDVGIREANWLVAFDLFKAFGAEFDQEFMRVFTTSIYEHGKHCINNLEYSAVLRSNHYLSDIAGILFSAAYLPSSSEINRWLSFAVQELITEMGYQFNSDGTNFEGSTSYHRLATEIMLYCSMLCLTLPKEKQAVLKEHYLNEFLFPDWYWERLKKTVEFTRNIMKPSGEIPQIGDNDSGRFLKIWPVYDKIKVAEAAKKYKNLEGYTDLPEGAVYLDENILNHKHIVEVGDILFKQGDFSRVSEGLTPEEILIENWMSGKTAISVNQHKNGAKSIPYLSLSKAGVKGKGPATTLPLGKGEHEEILKGGFSSEEQVLFDKKEILKDLTFKYGSPSVTIFEGYNLKEGLKIYPYPDFGLFIYKSPRLYMSVRCGSIGQKGKGGHSHNDQLSIELSINGKDVIKDPGTYLYTPIPEKRNYFRSTKVHFTPFVDGKEQNDMAGSFSMRKKSEAEVLFFNEDAFLGRLKVRGGESIFRYIKIEENKIEIQDFFKGTAERHKNSLYSNGYGKLS